MSQRRILIVDDNFELAENLAEILEDEGYTVSAFDGAEAALSFARTTGFDVALLDVRMPGIDGVDLHRALAETHPQAGYVLMTAFTADARVREALDAGVSCVLPKPIPVDALVRALGEAGTSAIDVLVVEDDPELAASLVELLAAQGFSALRALSFHEAEEDLDRRSVGAALIDVRLPDGNGADLARDMVARDVRVVLMTGLPPDELRVLLEGPEGLDAPLLTKPFPPERLLELLALIRPTLAPT